MKLPVCSTFACLFLLLPGCASNASAQDSPYTLHTERNEVIVDLFAVNHSTYLPDATFSADDVAVRNDGKAVKLASFTHSGSGSLRPLAVFVIAQCSLNGWSGSGSRFAQGHTASVAAGLQHLAPEDSTAAAGWCDDGTQQVHALSHSSASVSNDLEAWIAPQEKPKLTEKRKGELALQTMLRDISAKVGGMKPRALPVLIFLHQDDTGTNNEEYSVVRRILLEQSSVAFVVTDGKGRYQPSPGYMRENTPWVLRTLANDTGGGGFATADLNTQPGAIGDVIASVLDQLHGRYQLSFVPPAKDGLVHEIDVKLSDTGRAHHNGVLLRARTSYLAPAR